MLVIERLQNGDESVADAHSGRDFFGDRVGLRTIGGDGDAADQAQAVIGDIRVFQDIGLVAGLRHNGRSRVRKHRLTIRERAR